MAGGTVAAAAAMAAAAATTIIAVVAADHKLQKHKNSVKKARAVCPRFLCFWWENLVFVTMGRGEAGRKRTSYHNI